MHSIPAARRLVVAMALTVAFALAGAAQASAATYHLSPTGSDANAGTASSPLRTLAKAISIARAGDTFVLHAGTYGALGTTTRMTRAGTASAPITWTGSAGESKPVIRGHVKISASYQRFRGLVFDGPTGRVKTPTSDNPNGEQVQVAIDGATTYGVEISNSVIRDSLWHAGIYLANAHQVRIVGNHIYNNGNFSDPAQANLCHGIYFSSGSGLIANNVVERNVARGVQLYPSPRNVVVEQNTIVRNGKAGIQFANATADSVAVNNIVAFNGDTGIRSSSLTGTGNRAFRNVLWTNANAGRNLGGISMWSNTTADPRFFDSADYRLLTGSPAIDKADAAWTMPTDYAGFARPAGAGPDIGAYEGG